ncbi:VanZ family protein [Planotetraspora sp. A-T 1434]|uniref:VanZ family protein n=1 Tax=Planotetraspora sp. A-T 1434 TaxID=2979219 RepID=UPI0021C0ACA4|nr:VanZ family protein [Planotetraspora sp. A-T 1434]MCT9929720.1 VanZ family protein [Planotetraspora sp. A-T 1434]
MWLAWHMWRHVIIGALLAVPLALAAAHLLARRRAARRHPHPFRTAYADVFMVVGTAPWIWMILTPGSGSNGVDLVPFRDLLAVLQASPASAIVQVGGNLLVFAAVGALLPIRSARFARPGMVALVAATGSLTVELLQYVLRLHRFSSVDDVLLNTAGAVLAASMTQRWRAGRIPEGTVPR